MFPDRRRDVALPLLGAAVLWAVFVVGGLLYEMVAGGAAERLVTVMFVDAIVVLGIGIYVGNTGILSFGHIGFASIAGYTFALFAIAPTEKLKRIPDAPFGLAEVSVGPWGAVMIAVLVTVAVAAVIGVGLARSGAESGAVAATVITLALFIERFVYYAFMAEHR